jgi:hypothetical protein
MTKTIWICQDHYEKLCKVMGYEIPVNTNYNWFDTICQIDDCKTVAKHQVCEDEKDLEKV